MDHDKIIDEVEIEIIIEEDQIIIIKTIEEDHVCFFSSYSGLSNLRSFFKQAVVVVAMIIPTVVVVNDHILIIIVVEVDIEVRK